MLKFSGHDTFHCKEQWLLKGMQLLDSQNDASIFKKNEAISALGVGKNMVRSIQHWLRAFGMIDSDNEISELAKLLFLENRYDRFLEHEGSLWLLQYSLCHTGYASIYKSVFADYFANKASLEFSESQIVTFLNRQLTLSGRKPSTINTLSSDYKVFLKTYISPPKNTKTFEDDYNAPLLSLDLVVNTGRKNERKEEVYRINKRIQENLSVEVFAYCLLGEFNGENAINFDSIRRTLGYYLCLSNEGLEGILEDLCNKYPEFVFKDDAGVRQLQIKNLPENYKINLLENYYGINL
ncbi:DUF4007 family protein [Allomuricauda sp. NBRC 101325]|uniref:DUF4007 family protein n=1 Tax=Allomuricauda sp. NBRC 101325 TaxID=1113758 RepID=UPI0024A11A8A|nr:DUF4007 family protein [Muricauda sp. NBRC 101325]GLU45409.1 hypothetical protein Musp01_30330 [Muricauda sp. NBRC 101325]